MKCHRINSSKLIDSICCQNFKNYIIYMNFHEKWEMKTFQSWARFFPFRSPSIDALGRPVYVHVRQLFFFRLKIFYRISIQIRTVSYGIYLLFIENRSVTMWSIFLIPGRTLSQIVLFYKKQTAHFQLFGSLRLSWSNDLEPCALSNDL